MPRLARGTVTRRKRSGGRGVFHGWWIRGTTLDGRRTWIRAGDSAAEAEAMLARLIGSDPPEGPQAPLGPETPAPAPHSPLLRPPSPGTPSSPADIAAPISTPPEEAPPTVNDLLAAYISFAAGYYGREGQPTKQLDTVRTAVTVAGTLFGSVPVTADEAVAEGFADGVEKAEKEAPVFGLERFRKVPARLAAQAKDAAPLPLPAMPKAAEIAAPRVTREPRLGLELEVQRPGPSAAVRRRQVEVLRLGF